MRPVAILLATGLVLSIAILSAPVGQCWLIARTLGGGAVPLFGSVLQWGLLDVAACSLMPSHQRASWLADAEDAKMAVMPRTGSSAPTQ